eukprot:TRINITY_DN68430_c0_g1_i1.p1 TRINITY_DN68430_c0_g1~~TRINITY_DN68430_c0_g1_i1.p1  ORF type:complete len:412 (+),score=79.28 TRINITY_DN68430_c0_g1_i1:108-1343(+)
MDGGELHWQDGRDSHRNGDLVRMLASGGCISPAVAASAVAIGMAPLRRRSSTTAGRPHGLHCLRLRLPVLLFWASASLSCAEDKSALVGDVVVVHGDEASASGASDEGAGSTSLGEGGETEENQHEDEDDPPPANPGGELTEPGRIVSSIIVRTAQELKAEVIAAEAALALRAEVDGAVVTYDSPSVSIALRKVSADNLTKNGTKMEAPDKAGVEIPADPRVKGRHGGPVTITLSSYHTGDRIKEPPTLSSREFKSSQAAPSSSPRDSGGGATDIPRSENGGANRTTQDEEGSKKNETDRVDFFMTKTSVSWRGTVNVKVPGLGASVPAHDRSPTDVNFGEEGEVLFPIEKADLRKQLEDAAGLPEEDRLRIYRRLARKWHPDKNPEDRERATEVFAYLSTLKELLVTGLK